MSKSEKKGLGRGLSALLADVDGTTTSETHDKSDPILTLPIEKIEPNPDQPRRSFNEEDLDGLAASIREKGVIQPLIVRKNQAKPNSYQIIAGERRWRAAQRAQLHQIPVVIREFSDLEVLEVAIIENIQREDLNPIEEASGYQNLIDGFGHTQEQLAQAMGKSRPYIANLLRLLGLPADVRRLVSAGKLSAGHARALITSNAASVLAREVVAKGLSVRQTEQLVKSRANDGSPKHNRAIAKDPDTRALEQELAAQLGLKVDIAHKADGQSGELKIKYTSLEDLDGLCQLLSQQPT